MRYEIIVRGDPSPVERQAIRERIDSMLANHPALLRGESLVTRYNQCRIFFIPKHEKADATDQDKRRPTPSICADMGRGKVLDKGRGKDDPIQELPSCT